MLALIALAIVPLPVLIRASDTMVPLLDVLRHICTPLWISLLIAHFVDQTTIMALHNASTATTAAKLDTLKPSVASLLPSLAVWTINKVHPNYLFYVLL